jgi:hypothetical protein
MANRLKTLSPRVQASAVRPGERRGRDQLIQAPVGGFGDQDEEPAIG